MNSMRTMTMVLNQATPYKLINNCNILLVFYTLFHSMLLLHTWNLVGNSVLSCTKSNSMCFCICQKENSFLLFIIASVIIVIICVSYDESLLENSHRRRWYSASQTSPLPTNVLLDLMLLNY